MEEVGEPGELAGGLSRPVRRPKGGEPVRSLSCPALRLRIVYESNLALGPGRHCHCPLSPDTAHRWKVGDKAILRT